MYGKGIIKGLGVTLKHFIDTYVDDIKWWGKRYYTEEGIEHRMSKDARGVFTIQYPEEKMPVPEKFRFLPFLVYDEEEDGGRDVRCTACGICAKVCPPQCIWIERAEDPETGRPVPEASEFFIDMDICMNCGLCEEFCPFDAIIMDHDYEMSVYDRHSQNIFDMEKLLKPAEYYESIRPRQYKLKEEERAAKEARKRKRRQRRSRK